MNNVLLGKTVKGMYKLSGKTLTQLSEETDMTVDTINNLFYARLLKPGYQVVEELVKATGHTMAELDGFLTAAEELPADADVTEELARYLISVREKISEKFGTDGPKSAVLAGGVSVDKISGSAGDADGNSGAVGGSSEIVDGTEGAADSAVQDIHLYYEEQMRSQYKEQIAHMAETYERELDRLGRTNRSLKRINLGLLVTLVLVVVGIAITMLVHVL